MRLLLPIVAAVVPAVILPGFSFYFDITPKIVILVLGTALGLILWKGFFPEINSPAGWIAALLGLQIVWLGISSALSTNPALSLNGGNWRRFGMVSFTAVLIYAILVIVDCGGSIGRVAWYLRALVLAGIPIAAYGIMQHFGLDPWLSSTSYHAGEGPFRIVRPPGTLGHASYFGTALVYIAFAGVALALISQNRFWKTLGLFAALLTAFGVVLSGSRAAMLGIAIGATVLILRLPAIRTRRMIPFAIAFAAGFAALYFSDAGAGLRSRLHWSLEEPVGGARPLLWRDSVFMALHRPLAGYGPETFGAEFPRFESVALAKSYPDFQHESPHNIFLDLLTSEGLPGLLLLAGAVALAFYMAVKRADAVSTALAAALAGGVASQQFSAFTLPTALFLYLTVALIAGSEAVLFRPRALHLPARALAVLAAFALLIYGGRLALVDHELALTRDALGRVDLASALAHYRTVQRWHPAGSSADLYASRELANLFRRTSDVRIKLQAWTPAFRTAVRAARTSEQKQDAFYNLAIFFATQNDPVSVERSLRTSIAWAPNWFKPHWTLSKLLITQRRFADAEAEAKIAADLDGGKDLEVTRTLELVQAGMAATR
jgi:O-antigen ligase